METSRIITVVNGLKNFNSLPTKSILAENTGVYTACRTFKQNNIFEYKYHLGRLTNASKIVPVNPEKKEVTMESSKEAFSLESVEEYIAPSLKLAMKEMKQILKGETEMRIYMMLSPKWEEWVQQINKNEQIQLSLFDVFIRIEELPDPPKGPVEVEVRMIGGRKDPNYKYNTWVKQCEEYLKRKGKNVDEILLSDKDNNLYEGMSSNFFAIQKEPHSVITAPPDCVLSGTVAQVVEDYCKQKGVKLVHKNPNLNDISGWSSAFITSTSRQVLPVSSLTMLSEEDSVLQVYKIDSDSCPTLKEIRNHYISFLEKNSYQVI